MGTTNNSDDPKTDALILFVARDSSAALSIAARQLFGNGQ